MNMELETCRRQSIFDKSLSEDSSYIQAPSTPVESDVVDVLPVDCNGAPNLQAIDIAFHQLWVLPLLLGTYVFSRRYIYDHALPLLAVLIMTIVAVDYFWLSAVLVKHPAGSPRPICDAIATRACRNFSSSSLQTAARILIVLLGAAGMSGIFYGATIAGIPLLIGDHEAYVDEMQIIGASSGFVCGFGVFACPSIQAAASLLVYCGAFVLQSVNIVAFQSEVAHHSFILDFGELMAQMGVLIVLIFLFDPSAPPQLVVVHIGQHIAGLVYIYGCCSTMAVYAGRFYREHSVLIFQGVIVTAWTAALASFLWYARFANVTTNTLLNRPVIPSLQGSPSIGGVIFSGIGGVCGIFLASLWLPIPGTFIIRLVYSFLAVVLAQWSSGWWMVVRNLAGNHRTAMRFFTDGLAVLLPLTLFFYPYYRIDHPNSFLLPRSTLVALHILPAE
ncbi:hypothetical protein Ae201684_015017 [Aphanomyces euteiches]|uniref:Uncharacterized protein n=1 Tax=Aphanomyces euteiches TaxID=100861 RepID=A0A6G0WI48_9STRA|nr:hypothetical protein Ae201684_015017 [Aphanomyces euteiches]KAH9154956.1 hypothetical protein AeRB84_003022 [Aphanomyces euteiches]